MVRLEDLKREASRVLKEGKVKYVVGYQRSTNAWMAAPCFIKSSEDVEKLIWDPACVHNLTLYLVQEKKRKAREKQPDTRPLAVVVKGCDSRALNVLLQEKYINREDVFILGVSCEETGVIDEKKLAKKLRGKIALKADFEDKNHFFITTEEGKVKLPAEEILAERCLECRANFPVFCDVFFGEKIQRIVSEPFKSLTKIEKLSSEERWAFWMRQLEKCIRCYACRSVCPMCYCDECVVDSINIVVTPETTAEEKVQRIKWVEKSPQLSENLVYHLVRAIHLAGRCIDCGECERVCPVGIPVRFLNKKLEKAAKELFGYEVGFDPGQPSLFSSFRDDDPEDFIR